MAGRGADGAGAGAVACVACVLAGAGVAVGVISGDKGVERTEVEVVLVLGVAAVWQPAKINVERATAVSVFFIVFFVLNNRFFVACPAAMFR